MKPSRLAAAAALLACALSTPAHAAVLEASASISLKNLTITLIDLDPTDGIAPSIDFLDVGTNRYRLRSESAITDWQGTVTGSANNASLTGSQNSLLLPSQVSSGSAGAQSSAEITLSSISLKTAASLDTSTPQHDISRETTAGLISCCDNDTGGSFVSFFLGANTALRIQGQYDLAALLQSGGASTGAGQFASTGLYLNLASDDQSSWLADEAIAEIDGVAATRSGLFDLTLSNQSGSFRSGSFAIQANAIASVDSGVSPVPEPESIALMLAGLGVAGAIGARRRQRA